MVNVIISDSHDVRTNLARETYLMRRRDRIADRIVFLYVNRPAVVVGKGQNVFREVDWLEAETRGIPIVRRLSGGGAVYHDDGNLNIAVMAPRGEVTPTHYEPYLAPVRACLEAYGLTSSIAHTSDLMVHGLKIGGNAQALETETLLQHGTVLVSSDKEAIARLLHHTYEGMTSRGVASRQARVTTLADCVTPSPTMTRVIRDVVTAIETLWDGREITWPEDAERDPVFQEALAMYGDWRWNVARSPACTVTRTFEGQTVSLRIRDGVIDAITVSDDKRQTKRLSQALIGCPLRRETLNDALSDCLHERASAFLTACFSPRGKGLSRGSAIR